MGSWFDYSHKLGAGGMAEVLLASKLGPAGFERLVVIKRLLPHLKQDKTARQMFLDEARLAASLKHPNIVEIYEVGREEDEFFIVNKAHRNPRFVEDVVREMLRNVVEVYPDLPDSSFVLAKQENLESIHQHNAFAERYGTLGEVRREIIGGEHVVRHTTLEEWLKG